jgi:superfamily II DNA or RNA helicase
LNWDKGDPALQGQVRERQRITIENYANDPDLLAEHVGMEDNFQAGGYGERQIEELLQNAIDQLSTPGRVELRLVDGVLYCANEGSPFGAEGIKAVTGAFLSSKKDEKIGRFGLGFKSVLGVTDHPQVVSRSISFGFNEPEARQLLAALPYHPERVPTLRVPSVLDPTAIASGDPHLSEMMEWASTIVKLPLVRGGDRLRRRLQSFDVRYLLFPENLARVDIVLADKDGAAIRQTFLRRPGAGSGLVQLEAPGGERSEWRLLRKDHKVSDDVAKDLPGLFRREMVTVSYALEQGRTGIGEFWAWFPLLDQTTASGIFNAPWQVNDDRTSMLPGSALNRELLDVAADLLIDAALLESTREDPAKHFDVLPARGREPRSNADKYMSERIPRLARQHPLIPTSTGAMRAPGQVRAPVLEDQENRFDLPQEVIRRWADGTTSDDTPHWSCYSTATRRARLAQLLTDENDRVACKTVSPVGWLSETAAPRTIDAVDAALTIYLRLKEEKETVWKQFRGATIIPLESGGLGRVGDAEKILLPATAADAPDGVTLVEGAFASDSSIRGKLEQLGVKEVSTDQAARAAASSAHANWSDSEWSRLWTLLAKATPSGGRAAIESIAERKVPVKVPTAAGSWRDASEVFLDPAAVPGVLARQPDFKTVAGRRDLLEAAGCLDDLVQDYPVYRERAFAKYVEAMQEWTDKQVAEDFGRGVRGRLRFADPMGVGPLDVLLELSDSADPRAGDARARWSTRVLHLNRSERIGVVVQLTGQSKQGKAEMTAPDIWCVEAFGLLDSTLGAQSAANVLAASLEQYGELLPVALESFAGLYPLPKELSKAPIPMLKKFLSRDDYAVSEPDRLAEVLAAACQRKLFESVPQIPAIDPKARLVRLTPAADVVLATQEELDDLGSHSLRYLPSGPWDDALISAWGLQRAADVVAKSIDWVASGEPIQILDVYPTLSQKVTTDLGGTNIQRCTSMVRRTTSPAGVREQPLRAHIDGRTVLVDAELDPVDALVRASAMLRLGLTEADAAAVVAKDEALRKSKLVQDVLADPTEQGKLLKLVGREGLASDLPEGLLDIIERRNGPQGDQAVADLYLKTRGFEALRRLREPMRAKGLPVPTKWQDGSDEAGRFVADLGFPTAYAGLKSPKAPAADVVLGRISLPPLHPFQEDLLGQIREVALIRDRDDNHRRGLLYLPTGAGKTRVATEAIVKMIRKVESNGGEPELGTPILWIAQSEILCEQAIQAWTEAWRAFGDERSLEITRYWGDYEVDESLQELQVVVATDDKLARMIDRGGLARRWLQDAKLVVIDEAHTAGSPTYTRILRWLGIQNFAAGARTERPLLGLTATPYRGTNVEVNKQFVARFGDRRLEARQLEDDPIGKLREMQVLSRVEHEVLDSDVVINDSPTEGRTGAVAWDDVSRDILARLGDNLDRTQQLVAHILNQDEDWPILVFTPSVVSAHVAAALIRSLGRQADAVDGDMRGQQRRRKIEAFKNGETKVLVNCDLLTQGFDAPKVRALYIARPTFSPNRYVQMVGRGLRGPKNGGTTECLVVNVKDTFTQFDKNLAYTEFDYLWTKKGAASK